MLMFVLVVFVATRFAVMVVVVVFLRFRFTGAIAKSLLLMEDATLFGLFLPHVLVVHDVPGPPNLLQTTTKRKRKSPASASMA